MAIGGGVNMDDLQLAAEIEADRKEELMRESRQESKEEAMYAWIEDNKKYLMEDFCKDNDDFNEFCKVAFRADGE